MDNPHETNTGFIMDNPHETNTGFIMDNPHETNTGFIMDNPHETNTGFIVNTSQAAPTLFVMDNSQGTPTGIINDHTAEHMLEIPLEELIENSDLMASQTPILQGEGCPQPTPEQSSVPGCVNTPTMPDNYANSSARSNALGNTTYTQGQLSVPHIPGTLYSVSTTFQPDHFNSPPQFETLTTPTQYTPCTSGDRQESHGATGTDQTLNNVPVEPDNVRSRSQAFNTVGDYVTNDLNGFYAYEIVTSAVNTFEEPQPAKLRSKHFNYIGNNYKQEVQGEPSGTDFNELLVYLFHDQQMQMNSDSNYNTNHECLAVQDGDLLGHQLYKPYCLPNANTSCVNSNLDNEPQNISEFSSEPNNHSLTAEPTNLSSPPDIVDRQVNTDEGNQVVENVVEPIQHIQEPDRGDNEETLMDVNVVPALNLSSGISAITASEYTPPPARSRRSRKKESTKKVKEYERQEPYPDIEKERRRKDAIRAKNCREKNKSKMDVLEATIKDLLQENSNLSRENSNLSMENANLLQEVEARQRYECSVLELLKSKYNIVLQQYQQDWSTSPQ
nr:uncharacterized protein LOC123761633 isoform X2 [Procambarus clarkii]